MVDYIVLQKEDFSDFKIGDFPYDPDHSAMGEYHYYPPKGYRGNWYSNLADYGLKGPMWLIVKDGNQKAMESQVMELVRPWAWNMLVTGNESWDDYILEADIKMLNSNIQSGLAFRYQNSRCFYGVCFEEGKIKAIMRNHEDYVELVSESFVLQKDKKYSVKVIGKDNNFSVYIDDKLVLEFNDNTYATGKVAIFAKGPTQFSNLSVSCTKESYEKLLQKKNQEALALEEERKKYPQPKLWKTIDLKDFGAGRNIRFGDLTGDGQCDVIIAQCQKRVFKDRYGHISCLTAFDLEGNIIWQIGEPNPEHGYISADLPFQIADIDMDGKNEVIVSIDFKLMILEGSTGKVKMSIDTPISDDPMETLYSGVPFDQYAFDHVNVDCIRICNFTGKEKPTDILIKDRYNRLWAYDNQLQFLWKYHDGITGHFPFTKDINGDGKEEMVVGYNLVDSNGKKIWTLPVETDHTDEILIGPLDPTKDEDIIGMVSGDEGFILCDLEGKILLKELIGHAQRISAGNFRPEEKGYEIAITTYWGSQGIVMIYNGKGERLYSFEPGTDGNMITPVNWTGDGQDLILLNGNVEKGGMIDGYGRRVVTFPDDGHPDLCAEVIDLTGDCREEIVLWDKEKMYIYTQDNEISQEKICDKEKYPHYNGSNYRGEFSWHKKG
ncbi:hypothetical protein EDC18_10972 [Natranaerovirga pectinivora]|uniref:Rhamnogalacturonan lyase family 11 C-terminal domain-containing protein n=1 Tax=Natranaerovirga pectinivora TaxID=682400 RepID=A0A4V2UZX3_9FIRM|nr:hypothetical protein [Natranaerovirga pectinivora]TCT13109.1 hypothetical protein EDC18_10972 [Natranaerovirga pectinivora]